MEPAYGNEDGVCKSLSRLPNPLELDFDDDDLLPFFLFINNIVPPCNFFCGGQKAAPVNEFMATKSPKTSSLRILNELGISEDLWRVLTIKFK
jgi:hypothetical protein